MMKTLSNTMLGAALLGATVIASPVQAITLPPNQLPFAAQYHDFYSYSTNLLLAMQDVPTLQPYVSGLTKSDFGFGSGTVNPLIFANGGLDHNAPLPPPINSESGGPNTTFDGVWPGTYTIGHGSDKTTLQYYVLVSEILNVMNGPTVPVFMFDMSEPGSGTLLNIKGNVSVFSMDTNHVETVVKSWFFDNGAGGFVPVPGQISVPGYSQLQNIDSNLGNGFADFLAYAPDMDLSKYSDKYFKLEFELTDLGGSGEELGISSAFLPYVPPSVPEPGTMTLVGLGLAGIGFYGYRRKR